MYFHFSARTLASALAKWLPRLTSIDANTCDAVTIGRPFSPRRYKVRSGAQRVPGIGESITTLAASQREGDAASVSSFFKLS